MDCLHFHSKTGINKIRTNVPTLAHKPDHVLIKVCFCGICGSDIHILQGSSHYKDNITLGHEITGIIVKLGKNVKQQECHLSIGSCVAILPQYNCHNCRECRQGRPNFCSDKNGGYTSTIGYYYNGGFAEYVTCHFSQVYVFDNKQLPISIATLSEPLQCVLNGFNKLDSLLQLRQYDSYSDYKSDLKILIIGFGICGFLWSLLFEDNGFNDISVCELSKERYKIAKECKHINNVWLNKQVASDFESKQQNGFDIVIECAGTIESTKLGYSLLNTSGIYIIFGGTSKDSPMIFDPLYILFKELTIVGSFLGQNTMNQAIRTLTKFVKHKRGFLHNLDKLQQLSIVQFYRLDEFERAFDDCQQGKACKVMFELYNPFHNRVTSLSKL